MKLTLVVALDEYSLNQALERNFYACPASYGRDRGNYVAFYQTEPISSITHYAKVEEVFEDDGDFLSAIDRMHMTPNQSSNKATVFKLEEIHELDDPVENDVYGVQGAWYKDLDKIKGAERLSELKKE